MTEHAVTHVHHAPPAHAAHAVPVHHPHSQHHPAKPAARRKSSGRLRRLIAWEWGIVLALLSGLAITLIVLSHGPDPRRAADALVGQMKAALMGRPLGDPLFDSYPVVSGAGRETMVTMAGVPSKVCVLASWDLYRLGTVTVNGVTPQRVSAARLVDLCNAASPATIIWSPKTGN